MIKRKGSIVPKRFVKAIEKRSQHLVTFGCDVEILGNSTIVALADGDIIRIPDKKYVSIKKGKRKVKGFDFSTVRFIRKTDGQGSCIKVQGQSNIKIDDVKFQFAPPMIDTYI